MICVTKNHNEKKIWQDIKSSLDYLRHKFSHDLKAKRDRESLNQISAEFPEITVHKSRYIMLYICCKDIYARYIMPWSMFADVYR